MMGLFRIPSSANCFWGILYNHDFSKCPDRIFLLPIVGQEFFEVRDRIFSQSLNNIRQICPGFDAMTPAGREHGENDGMVRGAFIAAVKHPCTPAHGDVFHFALGVIVIDFQRSIGHVLVELRPVIKTVDAAS